MTRALPEQLVSLIAQRPGVVWLDGGAVPEGWSVVAWDPVAVHTGLDGWLAFARSHSVSTPSSGAVPFASGVLGFLGYGVGSTVESVPPDGPVPEGPVWLGRYEAAACYEHATERWHLTGPRHRRDEARALLDRCAPLAAPSPASGRAAPVDRDAYTHGVGRVLDWIAEGDCYQVNLTRVVDVTGVGDAFDAYRRIRRANPARHGAFLRTEGHIAILSNSPERLVSVHGRDVVAEPIKGTRPRGTTLAEDQRLVRELLADPKERAELTMIVDLTRNDLGRVARPGSVFVEPREITTHANVHHTHQRVHATLPDTADTWDAVCTLLPYGSITGAPKVRACQRIAQLEARPRGVYCGAIGFVADGGSAQWSVAIRTAVVDGDRARYHVGGGIVADSSPDAEWDETVSKGEALRRALCVVEPARI